MMQSNSTLHTKRLSVKTFQAFSLLWVHAPGYGHPYTCDVRRRNQGCSWFVARSFMWRGVSQVRTSSRFGYVTTALETGVAVPAVQIRTAQTPPLSGPAPGNESRGGPNN
jgi:hypothetical protein